jgi:hypothetical protein
MKIHHLLLPLAAALITGCSPSNSVIHNKTATNIVLQADHSKINTIEIIDLHTSFLNDRNDSLHNGSIVEISGEVIAFALTKEGLYNVTLRKGDTTVICIFDDSISGNLGDNRSVRKSSELTVQGQCRKSGLFSSSLFTLDGCRIVE